MGSSPTQGVQAQVHPGAVVVDRQAFNVPDLLVTKTCSNILPAVKATTTRCRECNYTHSHEIVYKPADSVLQKNENSHQKRPI